MKKNIYFLVLLFLQLTVLSASGYAAPNVTLTTSAVAAADINQGTSTNVIYITKMDVTNESVTVNNIQFTLSGNHDNDDLGSLSVYFNATSPVISGASYLGAITGNFAAPHAYSVNISRTLAAGTSGYFLITANVNSGATDNHTIRITGATTPVTFGYTTSVNVTNNQNNNGGTQTIQSADILLTTSAVAAASLNQGTSTNVVYITKMDVQTEPVSVNNIQFTLSGNHDNDDLGSLSIYFNATSPVISGASYLGAVTGNFAAPHAYSVNISRTLAAGTSGYFLITANINSGATDNHTIRITGATTPVLFGYTTTPNVTNNQNNGGGVQTIQSADILLTTSPVAAADLNQGTSTNVVYITKMEVQTEPVTVNNIQFTLSGNHDNDDLGSISVYFNATSPVISGASYLGAVTGNFAAPHAYSINISRTLSAATSGYYLITANINSGATDNHTIRITGATTPVTFGYTTTPNVTNNQNNSGAVQTIQGADILLTTSAVAAANLNQGTNTNVVYITKMDVQTEPVTVNNIQFTLSGNHDNDDLGSISVYFNATSPVISGASYLGAVTGNFAAPHAYSINISRTLSAATSGYYLITANINSGATDNHTIRITGATTPVTFGYTTSPKVTNNQNNSGAVQTIQAADILLTTSPVAAADINQGTNTNVVYITKMEVQTEPVTVNNIQFTLSGNHDNDDLGSISVYFNATSPVISGASYLGAVTGNFAAPHAYSINISRTLSAATSGYYLITANINSGATDNHTIRITGATTPVTFGYTTTPNVTNNQNNGGAVQTIQAADVTLTTSPVAAGNIATGSNTNVIYITKMDVQTEPVTVNNIQFTFTGTHDNDDLGSLSVYFNPTSPVISGASYLGAVTGNFAAPHTYSINISRTLSAATNGYFLITANVNSTASIGKTVNINGATNPVVFTYTTTPNKLNSQTNGAGVKTISASLIANADNQSSVTSGNTVIAVNLLYPNPVSDVLNFTLTSENNNEIFIQLTDLSGKTVISKKADVVKGTVQLSMNVHSLSNGSYYFNVYNKNNTLLFNKKLIVQH